MIKLNSAHAVVALALASAGLGTAQTSFAQTITDGNSSFLHTPANTTGASVRTGTTGGTTSNLIGGGDTTDQLFQTWWWYRVNAPVAGTREFALSNRTNSNAVGNVMELEYVEPEGFRATMKYTLTDGPDAPASCNLAADLEIVNTSAAPLSISIFCYVDLDLESVGTDSATLLSPGRIRVVDQTTSFAGEFLAVDAAAYQVGAFATVRNLLTDTAVTNLNNSGLPFAAADYSGAQQWNLTIAPGARQTVRAAISLNMTATPSPAGGSCPADFNAIDGLTVADIFDFLNAWFMSTPSADFNGADGVTVADIFDFLNAWFTGCP